MANKNQGHNQLDAPSKKPQPTQEASRDSNYELGKLNRHWYRRGLDALAESLRSAGSNPSVRRLQSLADEVVGSFLKAIASQAPDSYQPQFPADRAYFIPFEGDLAGSFNFAKPYYQLLDHPKGFHTPDRESLWSFLPWSEAGVEIDPHSSVADGETKSFEELLSPREKGRRGVAVTGDDKTSVEKRVQRRDKGLLLKKSLLLRTAADPLSGLKLNEVDDFALDIKRAVARVFKLYKEVPGNPGFELLLRNHVYLLTWMASAAGMIERVAGGTDQSMKAGDFEQLLPFLLQNYFLGDEEGDTESLKSIALQQLCEWSTIQTTAAHEVAEEGAQESTAEEKERKREAQRAQESVVESLYELRDDLKGTPFFEALGDEVSKTKIRNALEEIRTHLASFNKYFLGEELEKTLETDLAAATADDPRRAGRTDSSYVWVCADFNNLKESLPDAHQLEDPTDPDDNRVKEIQKSLDIINGPYRSFFRQHESTILSRHVTAIEDYWRTRGEAARKERIYTSFLNTKSKAGIALPPQFWKEGKGYQDPYPQNIFLRVCIRDSVNEPFIDGLFVFSNDYDEVDFAKKETSKRREDLEDLLAFAKVFFFIVRDHLHGLDRARDAADIGTLNQHLFDQRLQVLDTNLNRRLSERKQDISEHGNWSRLVYELLNNYAQALIDKPAHVRNETFPYDRLLILPVAEISGSGTDKTPTDLPFFLFQSIFVESIGGKIDGSHYSLVKPFQSPVEEEDSKLPSRFRSRTFQSEFEADSKIENLNAFLQKHYVGVRSAANGGLESSVVKAKESDDGRTWAEEALLDYWAQTSGNVSLWQRFLSELTRSYQQLGRKKLADAELAREELWFLIRFAFLRGLLALVDPSTNAFKKIRRAYRGEELKLKFGDKQDDDMLWLGGGRRLGSKNDPRGEPPDVYGQLMQRNQKVGLADDPLRTVSFVDYLLSDQDDLMLGYLEFLTQRVRVPAPARGGRRKQRAKGDGPAATWYQPLLTRPLEAMGGDPIGPRIPQYRLIRRGDDAVAMFLGAVNFDIGRSEHESRRLRCVVAMIRDFDDSKVGVALTERDIREKLSTDLDDLTLFTRTFFQNAERSLTTARESQQIRVLSTEVTQIARNWYSNGIDVVVTQLRKKLREMLKDASDVQLGRLRPELVQGLFDAMIGDVMLRPEHNRTEEGALIELESFPFDRVLHVPLLFGSRTASCLSYARTTVPVAGVSGDTYEVIRQRGRHRVLGGGKKILATAPPLHFRIGDDLVAPTKSSGSGQAGARLYEVLRLLADDSQGLMDGFTRRLYRANSLQGLTVGGLIAHLLEMIKHVDSGAKTREQKGAGAHLWDSKLARVESRLDTVLRDSIRSLEPDDLRAGIHTEVHMDRGVNLELMFADSGNGNADGDRRVSFERDTMIPAVADFFRAAEGGEQYEYGLQQGVPSKLFHVFYSIPAPQGFIENLDFGPRYRGVFCFVVDDSRTDEKSRQGGSAASGAIEFSDEEISDQEDIRTFIHNTMSSLVLVLEQQALENRIRQPGVEQFISGMLHRLKNELNEPLKALYAVEDSVRASPSQGTHKEKLLARIRDGETSIKGVEKIFQQLKASSENQRGIIPMQSFPSTAVGWMFVEDLCIAALKKVAEREKNSTLDARQLAAIRRNIADIGRSALEQRARDDRGDVIERVHRKLHEVGYHLERFINNLDGTKTKLQFLLSLRVHSSETLQIRGSHHLPEALNILIENSFQAAWDHAMRERKSGPEGDALLSVRVGLVCRKSDQRADEILIEIQNSSGGLPVEFKDMLNAEPPQPISAQRYTASGGSKKTGSGFGHYYARRTIRELCGGLAARRLLDAHIHDVEGEKNLTQVVVNLLEAKTAPPQLIPAIDLLSAAAGVFPELEQALTGKAAAKALGTETEIQIPGDVGVGELCHVVRELLEADRALKRASLVSFARNEIGRDIRMRTEFIRRQFVEALRYKRTPAATTMRQEITEEGSSVRVESFHDLSVMLAEWRSRSKRGLDKLIQDGGEKLAAALEGFQATGKLVPTDILSEKQKAKHIKKFSLFHPFLKPEVRKQGFPILLRDLGKDKSGKPEPSLTAISQLFKKASWELDLERGDSGLRLAFRLCDDGESDAAGNDLAADEDAASVDVLTEFAKTPNAYSFAQYQGLFRAELDGRPIGGLRFLRYPSADSPARDVMHRTIRLDLTIPAATTGDTPEEDPG